jgi:hypothetical protein
MYRILQLKTFFIGERWLCKLQSTKAMHDLKNNFTMNGIFEIKIYSKIYNQNMCFESN